MLLAELVGVQLGKAPPTLCAEQQIHGVRGQRMRHRTVATNGIELHVAEEGQGRPVILCHGFPELAYSWRHQLPALAEAGYRAVAPDMRGFGDSSIPAEIEAYDVITLTRDLIGLLLDPSYIRESTNF